MTGVNCGLLILQLRFDAQITSILSSGFPKSRLSSPFWGLNRTESDLGERRGLRRPPSSCCGAAQALWRRLSGEQGEVTGSWGCLAEPGECSPGETSVLPQNSQENRRGGKRDAGVAPASLEVQTHCVSPGTAEAPPSLSLFPHFSLLPSYISGAFIVGLGFLIFRFGFFFHFSSLKCKYLLSFAFDIWGL